MIIWELIKLKFREKKVCICGGNLTLTKQRRKYIYDMEGSIFCTEKYGKKNVAQEKTADVCGFFYEKTHGHASYYVNCTVSFHVLPLSL